MPEAVMVSFNFSITRRIFNVPQISSK